MFCLFSFQLFKLNEGVPFVEKAVDNIAMRYHCIHRQKLDTEKIPMENPEVDGRGAATFCGVDENDVDVSPAALVSRCSGKTREDSDEMQSTISCQHLTSATPNSRILSSGDITSTSLTPKIEPDTEEETNSTPRQENNKRCCDNMNDVIKASTCAQSVHDGRCVHFTASYPPVSFSHRHHCPCEPLPSSGITDAQYRRRRRRPGLSRLRRTELRRRSRTVTNFTEDRVDGGLDETASVAGLDVDQTAPSDVTSAESHTVFGGHHCDTNSEVLSKSNAVEPKHTDAVAHSSTSEIQPTPSVTSSVVGLTTTMIGAHESPENRQTSENKSDEEVATDINFDSHVANKSTMVENECPLPSMETAAGLLPAVSACSFDVSRKSMTRNRASPLSFQRTDSDIVSLCSVVNTPVAVPFTPVLNRTRTQSVIVDAATVRSPIVAIAARRCYTDSAVRWRRCDGEMETQRDIVVWMQTRRGALAAPTLRYSRTALKRNTVALINSPACHIPRHIPIFYPRYRLLCYPPSPCV